jgi:multiple RNA-binding domain-containing protein 1
MAYISYASPDDAVVAYKSLDKKAFQGRLLHILGAVDRKGKAEVVEGEGKSTVKDERMAKRKAAAGKEFNWSMLYMNVSPFSLSSQYDGILTMVTERCRCVFHR